MDIWIVMLLGCSKFAIYLVGEKEYIFDVYLETMCLWQYPHFVFVVDVLI